MAGKSKAVKLARVEPGEAPSSSGVMVALNAVRNAQRRKPTEADRPPQSTFPMTPAARAAVQLGKGVRRESGV